MRIIYLGIFLLLLASCGGQTHSSKPADQSDSKDNETIIDTLSFEFFKEGFRAPTLPYKLDSFDVWDGDYFKIDPNSEGENEEDWDYETSKIPKYQLEQWILGKNDQGENELCSWIEDHGANLDDDRWYMIHKGIAFEKGNQWVGFIFVYEKRSEINGGSWTYYMITYNDNEELEEIARLGGEGINTSTHNSPSGDFWQRFAQYDSFTMGIDENFDIKVCEDRRDELEGDLRDDERAEIDNVNIFLFDGLRIEYFDEKCVEY